MNEGSAKLGDFIEIKHGYAFEGKYFVDNGPYVLLTPGNFAETGGFVSREKQKHYDGPTPSEFVLASGDLLVAMTEQAEGLLGSAAFVPDGKPCLHNQRLGLIKPKPSAPIDLNYVYYLFNSRLVRTQIRASCSGTKVRHTSPSRIYAVHAPIPCLSSQRRIASILGAYDDLIAINRRRIALLEEMARRLFEEWFVHFRFPGHEQEPTYETPEGTLPINWRLQSFFDVTEVLSGGTPLKARQEFWSGDIPFFTPRDAPATAWAFETDERITEAGLEACNSQLYEEGTTFITARGTVGKIALVARPMAMNQSCYALRGRGYPPYFIFELTRATVSRLRAMSNGAVFDTIIVDTFKKLTVVVPPLTLATRFDATVEPLLWLSRNLTLANIQLTTARDLLLPRLISGELRIATAESELEAAE